MAGPGITAAAICVRTGYQYGYAAGSGNCLGVQGTAQLESCNCDPGVDVNAAPGVCSCPSGEVIQMQDDGYTTCEPGIEGDDDGDCRDDQTGFYVCDIDYDGNSPTESGPADSNGHCPQFEYKLPDGSCNSVPPIGIDENSPECSGVSTPYTTYSDCSGITPPPTDPDPETTDTDGDGTNDSSDSDIDGDGVNNDEDPDYQSQSESDSLKELRNIRDSIRDLTRSIENGSSSGGGGGNGDGNGSGTGSASGDCDITPPCDGDAVQCAILTQNYIQSCGQMREYLNSDEQTDVEGRFTQMESDGKADITSNSETVDVGAILSTGLSVTETTGVCPAPIQLSLNFGGNVEVSYQPLCDLAQFLRPLFILIMSLVSARIALRGIL